MPKKGKGQKGKQKADSQPGQSSRGQEEPGPPAPQAGRGRGRGAAAQPSTVERSQDVAPKKDTKGSGEKQFFESGDGKQVPKGRGRGRGSPPQSVGSVSPGFQEQQRGSITDYPELSASALRVEPSSVQETSVKKKVFSKEEQENILSQVANIKLEHKKEITEHRKFAVKPSDLPLINDRNRIQLLVNYFKLKFKQDIVIYHYDIDISDSTKDNKIGKSVLSEGRTAKEDIKKKVKHVEREKRRNMGKAKCRQIISEAFKKIPALRQFCPVYDGQKNLFTSKPLPVEKKPYPVDIKVEDKDKRFYVTITPVTKEDNTNIISLEPLVKLYHSRIKIADIPYEVLLVYDTVMKHREPAADGSFQQVAFRNSFFSLRGDKDNLGCGLEVWFGYHQNVQLTDLGPVVVINLAAKAFHKSGNVIDYASDVLGTDIRRLPRLENWQISTLTDSIKGVQIKVNHQSVPRKYKIKSVTDTSATNMIFENDNRRVSVAQYFLEKYRKKLLYPQLPLLLMQTSNKTYMPMEVCDIIEGQPKIGKLNADLTSKMIRGTAVAPQRRMQTVSKTAVEVNNTSRNYMQAFGLLMDVQLTKVDGRIMVAPQLAYAPNKDGSASIAKPDMKGVWRVEDGKKFYRIVKIEKWLLISFADERRFGQDVLGKYCDFLCKSARKCGMQLDRPLAIDICGRNVSTEQALTKAKKIGAQFAIVVLNRRDNRHTYDEVKFLSDFKYNLVTQCMEDKTLSRINDQITTNVCLKINVKLGGINHILWQKPRIFSEPVTVLGVDAIHWTRGYGYPSIVSVVGSLNPTASRYALTCDLQRNEKHDRISQEIIRDMGKVSGEILKAFRETNNRHPNKIIVFRDGVSEGQFQHALDHEVSGIQQACMDLFKAYIPITFIVVQKRHHTRFFPANPSQGVGRNQNVPPGTCVDRAITHPVFFDYFICSHEGIQGTSKPAHYTVLHDDNKFTIEELQQLCYFLCHTYVRCTRSVSLPAPVMYADLAAARAKKYADLFITGENMSVSSGDEPRDLPRQVEEAIKSMRSFENNMFYV